jgi:hypothetical protein
VIGARTGDEIGTGRALAEHSIRFHIAGASLRIGRSQRLVVLEHPVIERIRDEKISRKIDPEARRPASSGCARRRRRGRTRARIGGEACPSRALAEDSICDGIARSGSEIQGSERLIEFEHSRVIDIRDVKIGRRIDREAARTA